MKLNETTAMDVIRSPRSKSDIDAIKKHESQLRVFTETMTESELNSETYWTTLMAKMKNRSDKKFDRVKEFARFPLPVVQLCDSVLSDVFKVFDGKNRFFSVDGDREIERLEDWIQETKPANWIEKQARKVFKNRPCSFVVVDRDDAGQPFLILVDSDRLVDVEIKDDDGNCEFIAFIHSKQKHETKPDVITTFFSVYDDESYFVFKRDSDDDLITKVSENKHNIGWCPAKTFIRTMDSHTNKLKRRVAFSSALSKLEDWTLFDIYRNFVDHYAPFPVTESPVAKCPNPECEGGQIRNEILVNADTGETKTAFSECAICASTKGGQHIFPGTHIGIKVSPDKDVNDGSGVFKMIFPDTDKLKYVPEKLDKLEIEIRYKTAGMNQLSNEAFNELQVKGSFASMESVLLRTKREMDDIYRFIVKTVSRIFYKGINVTVDANFGTEFYLISEEDLQNRFDQAKKIGLPVEEMLNIYKQLIETKYKGNPEKRDRTLMLLDLDPYPMNTFGECVELKKEGLIDQFHLSLKINFTKYISKFEAENAPITQFGLNLEYWQRIEKIQQTLEQYNTEWLKEMEPKVDPPQPPPGTPPGIDPKLDEKKVVI